ncbi:class I SAM-dependent methyltransferase [Tsukamurella sp. 1534]|uniref:class I SAM-dependent methyltransferase n=1 Tax=Tsukamurella sp. 1534 TaxID=1151061 RepID=UPI0003165B83|nr:class I SAM-dependent methyltransferase [Tsukamurella sp. 1534]
MVNEAMRQVWAETAPSWVEHEQVFDRVGSAAADAILAVAGIGPGDSVLDVGCGTGALLAAAIDAGASATGVDISAAMTEAAAARVPAADVLFADAQTEDLASLSTAPFDRVVSRHGVMFFDDPVGAFANIRRACSDGARLAFVCWRTLAENPTFTLGAPVLMARMPELPPMPPPGAPGPMSLAEPERVRGVLGDSGWADVTVEPLDYEFVYGAEGDDGVDERVTMLLGTPMGQAMASTLEPALGPDGWAALLDELRAEVRKHVVDGHVRHPAACWLVTASSGSRA